MTFIETREDVTDEFKVVEKERDEARDALRKAADRFKSLISAIAQIVWTTDADGQVREDIPAWRVFTGQLEEEVKGWGWLEAVHPDDMERVKEVWQKAVDTRSLYYSEFRVRRHDGKYRNFSVKGAPVLEEDGRIREWVGGCTDITERKLMEEALLRANAYNRSLIEASLDPLVTISPDGKITDVNEATVKVTGVSRAELIGTDFSDYFTEPDMARAGYQQVFKEGSVRNYALEIRRRDGHTIPVLYNACIYKDEAGNVIGVFAAARDITEQRKMIEQLNEQQKAFMEVSVPVVSIWSRILLVPLIGVFDSRRAQLVMETLLAKIEDTQAKVAILDISGIPVMDTLVAKYLLRTVSAARLMGTECIITGIRAPISQTIVHLGVDLSGVLTKTTLDEGIKKAFDFTNMKVAAK